MVLQRLSRSSLNTLLSLTVQPVTGRRLRSAPVLMADDSSSDKADVMDLLNFLFTFL